MNKAHYPPRRIFVLLILQFVGLFLLIIAQLMTSPLAIALPFALGTVLIGLNIAYWTFLVIRKAFIRFHISYPPRRILILIGFQFFGLALLLIPHFTTQPIGMALPFALGTALIGLGMLCWVIQMVRESSEIATELKSVLKNKPNT